MKEKLENFWYHHKIGTIIAAAAIVFVTVVGIQFASKQSYDLYILYAGAANVNETYSTGNAIATEMQKSLADISGDSDLRCAVQSFVWVNDDLAKEYKENDVFVNASENRRMLQTVMDAIASGKSPIMLLDRAIFDQVESLGALEKLSDVLGTEVGGAIDEYGINLGDTSFGRSLAGFRDIPRDTVVCVRNKQNGFSLIGKDTGGEKWERQLDIFRKLMKYGSDDID